MGRFNLCTSPDFTVVGVGDERRASTDINWLGKREKNSWCALDQGDMERVKGEELCYLTTEGKRTRRPHRVELWFAYRDGRIYLSHEGDYTDWMKNLSKNERALLEMGGLIIDADAKVPALGEARERGMHALYEKYYGPASREVIEDWFELSTVVELIPRFREKTGDCRDSGQILSDR